MSLDDWRSRINEFDEQILHLLNQRARAAIAIGELKRRHELPYFAPEREAQILDRLVARFGAKRVLRFCAVDSHDPARAARLVPTAAPTATRSVLASSGALVTVPTSTRLPMATSMIASSLPRASGGSLNVTRTSVGALVKRASLAGFDLT